MVTNSNQTDDKDASTPATRGGAVGNLFSKSGRLPPRPSDPPPISVVPQPDPDPPVAPDHAPGGSRPTTEAPEQTGAHHPPDTPPVAAQTDNVPGGDATGPAGTSKRGGRKPRPKAAAARQAASSPAAEAIGVPQPVPFRVAPDLRDALHAARKATKASITDIVLDAIALNVDEIRKQLSAQRPAKREGGLFSRVYTQRPIAESDNTETNVQVNIRLFPDDLATIEQLWEEAGARDRSHFISTALRIHLGKAG